MEKRPAAFDDEFFENIQKLLDLAPREFAQALAGRIHEPMRSAFLRMNRTNLAGKQNAPIRLTPTTIAPIPFQFTGSLLIEVSNAWRGGHRAACYFELRLYESDLEEGFVAEILFHPARPWEAGFTEVCGSTLQGCLKIFRGWKPSAKLKHVGFRPEEMPDAGLLRSLDAGYRRLVGELLEAVDSLPADVAGGLKGGPRKVGVRRTLDDDGQAVMVICPRSEADWERVRALCEAGKCRVEVPPWPAPKVEPLPAGASVRSLSPGQPPPESAS